MVRKKLIYILGDVLCGDTIGCHCGPAWVSRFVGLGAGTNNKQGCNASYKPACHCEAMSNDSKIASLKKVM